MSAAQMLALPDGVVGVLDGRLLERRLATFGERGVQLFELAEEDAVRECVERDVVEPDQQYVIVWAELEERRPHHQIGAQVERLA